MRSLLRLSLLAASIAVVAPSSAHAQFGGLMKKAKEQIEKKAVEQAGDKVGPVAPGEQVTDELLAKVISGAQAADRVLAERDRIQAQRETANRSLSDLISKNGPVHSAYDQANSKILDCRDASFSSLEKARDERLEKRMEGMKSDPAFMGKMQLVGMKYGKAMADAQAKNDALALSKAQKAMMQELLGEDVFADVKKDTVATDSKCGKLPAKPAALAQEEALQKEVDAFDDKIRTLEARAVNVGAQASGIEQVRYLALKERTFEIMQRLSGKSGNKYADAETEAVRKRVADLEKVKRAL